MTDRSSPKTSVWTAANKVTLARILLIPVFVVAIISPWPAWFPQWPEAEYWKPWIAAGIFIAIAFTDTIDGQLARSRGEVTDLGKFMDPLADKILVAAALLALVELGPLPSWVALIILAREFIISGLRMVAASKNVVIAASWYGKAKTVFQIIAIVLFIIKDSDLIISRGAQAYIGLYAFSWLIMGIALVLTILSMLDYFAKASQVLGFAKTKNKPSDAEVTRPESGALRLDLASRVIDSAVFHGRTIATAESCTGGRIGSSLTHIAGASDVYLGGVISYANSIKEGVLGVSDETLDQLGAVSEQTACQMAQGACKVTGADIAVSATGIAGPGGATPDKPVGTVWIGVSSSRSTRAQKFSFSGTRSQIRTQSVNAALELLLEELGDSIQ